MSTLIDENTIDIIKKINSETAKIYKQKGMGRARHGSKKVVQFKGGGVVHGPTPRSHEYKLNTETLLVNVIYISGLLKSKSEARRMIKQGAVKINDSIITDLQTIVKPGEEHILKVGKRRFLRLK